MGRPRKEWKNWDELGTLWEVSDELWAQIARSWPRWTRPRRLRDTAFKRVLRNLPAGSEWTWT